MPLPTTSVIPDGWQARHATVSKAAMTSTCTITRPVSPTAPAAFNPATGRSTMPTTATVYTGACRVTATMSSSARTEPVGEQPRTPRTYLVSILASADQPQVRDLVTITTAADAEMVGARLTVVDIRRGSLAWDRVLLCEEQTPTTR